MDIAWILLSVIFLIFIIILFLNKKRKDRPNQEINLNEQIVINQSNTDSKIIPSHRISLDGNDISLKKVLLLFKEYDIKLNNKGIFEKVINAESTYYVANLNEPGYFDDDKNIKGFTFFFLAKDHIFDRHTSDQMKEDSENIAQRLNGHILEDSTLNIDKSG
jgi:FtsZ-interacting cell division protein ZipA